MFSDTFYPTPPEVVREMLRDVRFRYDEMILDPSAGKGDILDYIQEHYGNRSYNSFYACEIVPELCAILEKKGYPVLANDFLTYKPTMYFTKVVMNPPFDHAEDHIFRAFKILGHGQVVSLIPTSSLEGKNSKERLLLEMIEKYGTVRDLGQVFRHAERPTNENISLIVLKKEEDPFNLDFDPVDSHEHAPNFSNGPDMELVIPGFVPGLVAQYNAAFAAVEDYIKARLKLEKYVLSSHDVQRDPMLSLDKGTPQERFNGFVRSMNMLAWEKILDHPDFQSVLTERARDMVGKFRSRQRYLDFNVENIITMFERIREMAPDLLAAVIDDAFDEFTKYHKENREHWEGWKTDLCWKVARKVVLPWCTDPFRTRSDIFQIDYMQREKFNDVDRAMSVLSEMPYSSVTKIVDVLNGAPCGVKVYSTFFEATGYKKGTVHLVFRDEDLLNKFNYTAAKNKGWLPDGSQSRFDF